MTRRDWHFQPIKGKRPTISWESISDLKIDDAYQRAIDSPASQRLIKDIACGWNWELCSVLIVSDRGDDGYFVMDGQHRLAAARMRTDVPHLPCVIVKCETRESEARRFVEINTNRKSVTPLDKFRARLMIGDEEAVAINNLVESAGLKIGRSAWSIKDGEITAVAVMSRMFRQYGAAILSAALVNMAEAWPGKPQGCAQELLPGLCLLLYANSHMIDPELLPSVLASRDQGMWFAGALHERNESDEDSVWPDEVFRDVILSHYQKLEPKLKAA